MEVHLPVVQWHPTMVQVAVIHLAVLRLEPVASQELAHRVRDMQAQLVEQVVQEQAYVVLQVMVLLV